MNRAGIRLRVPEADLVIENVAEIATPAGRGPLAGSDQGHVETIEDGAIAVRDGRIVAIGADEAVAERSAATRIDGTGGTLVPGFVDAHTHLVFAGERAHEMVMKLDGASYEEILAAGGGIHSTVEATRRASDDALVSLALDRLDRCLAEGTTTLEAKSGYALTPDGEARLLRLLGEVDEAHPIDLVRTLLGAHALPRGVEDRAAYVDAVADELTPRVADEGLASFCDAFVDEGAFTVDEGRRLLEAGREAGLDVRVHADELACTRATRLGLELEAASIDHVNRVHDDDVAAWGKQVGDGRSSVATLCPVTPFTTTSVPYAPARDVIEAGIPLALGSDLNPNAYSEGMWFTLALAVHGMRMQPTEALVAATANSAHSLGLDDRGRLAEGLAADAVLLDVPSHEHIGYRMGPAPVRCVVKDGQVVHGG